MNKSTKYILLLCLFFLTYLIYGQKNNGFVLYKKSLRTPISYEDIKNTKFRDFNKSLVKASNELEYKLEFTAQESTFKVIEILESDGDRISKFAIRLGSGNGIRYTNINTKELIHQKDAYGKQFLIVSSLDSIKWKLINESKNINGYKCFKAITSEVVVGSKKTTIVDVVAWYEPKIPISFGPVGYGGLPGLIIELQIDKYKYYLTKIELNSKKEVKIQKPIKGKRMTLNEFLEYEKELAGQNRSYMRN